MTTSASGSGTGQDLGDIGTLAASIGAVGLLHPIVVSPAGELIAGRRRLQAVRALGWEEVPVHVVDGLGDTLLALRAERDENTCRKDLTPSEAVSIGKSLEELERPKAEDRQKAGANQHTEPSGKLPEGSKGQTRDKVAEAVGMSGRNYSKAKAVVEAAEADPTKYGDLPPAMDQRGNVHQAFVELKRRQKREELETKAATTPRASGEAWKIIQGDCLSGSPPPLLICMHFGTVFDQQDKENGVTRSQEGRRGYVPGSSTPVLDTTASSGRLPSRTCSSRRTC